MTGTAAADTLASGLRARIAGGTARIGVIGLGYVGLPLALRFAAAGHPVTGFDIDPAKIEDLAAGRSYIRHIPAAAIAEAGPRFAATADFRHLADMDAVLICVPTPLTRQREPDMSFVVSTAETVAAGLRHGQLVVLESSTYPGTTAGLVRPILERGGLRSGIDFYLAYSPEREDPGSAVDAAEVPRVVSGDGPAAQELAGALYARVVRQVVPVSSIETAEAVKLTENIFRAINIALVNELKVIFTEMGIDVWEVVAAADSKPFGFMPFYPGPGIGGHCIPVDPFYLTWKAREFGISTKLIELAGEINAAMPGYVVQRLALALNERFGRALRGAHVLLLGVAYKRNVEDIRESPSLVILELLERQGAVVDYHDPHVPELPPTRRHPSLTGRRSVALDRLAGFDAAIVATDHDLVDYRLVAAQVPLVLDTRNALAARGLDGPTVVRA